MLVRSYETIWLQKEQLILFFLSVFKYKKILSQQNYYIKAKKNAIVWNNIEKSHLD